MFLGNRICLRNEENKICVESQVCVTGKVIYKKILEDNILWEKYSKNAYKITSSLHPEAVNQKWEEYLCSVMKI